MCTPPAPPPPPRAAPSAGHAPARRRLVAFGAALWLLAPPGPGAGRAIAQAGFDLGQLMQTLAKVRSGAARFTEQRQIAMLDQTLESSGRLFFEAPDTFVRETLEPRPERIAVVGNQLTLTQGSRSRSLALDSSPEAAVIVEAIRGTLTGNRAALERHFNARVSGDARQWRLELVPRDNRVLSQVRSIQLLGFASDVREVLVSLADGDRSVMNIEPVAPGGVSPAAAPPAAAALAAPGGARP